MPNDASQISFVRTPDSTLIIQTSHEWYLDRSMPSANSVSREIAAGGVRRVAFDTSGLTSWDSSLITFFSCRRGLVSRQPHRVGPISASPRSEEALGIDGSGARRGEAHGERRELGILAHIGVVAVTLAESAKEDLRFVGGLTISVVRAFRGEARFAQSICCDCSHMWS